MGSIKLISDPSWGCDHHDYSILSQGAVKVCLVSVRAIEKLAHELTTVVTNSSWITGLDPGTRRGYERTVKDTAELLVKIFESMDATSPVSEEFGEVMVSMGAARALEIVFGHRAVPLAELWKPQLKQNEGFDFHTECQTPLINFGEAKYSGTKNPHGLAMAQIDEFLDATKHLRDRPHLINVCSPQSVAHLDSDRFGVVAAFSVNGKSKEVILANARKAALGIAKKHAVEQLFIVGVVCEAK